MSNIQSDEELINASNMLVAQLSEIHQKLARRNVEISMMTFSNGKIEIEYERVVREKLKAGK